MKKITLIAIVALIAVSCKKEKSDPSPSFTFESVSSGTSGTVSPGTDMKLASYTFSMRNMELPGIDLIRCKTSGTVKLGKIKNLNLVIKDRDSVVVWQGTKNSFSSQATVFDLVPNGNTILVDKPGTYSLTITADVMDGTFGTLAFEVQLIYSWVDQNDVVQYAQTDYVKSIEHTFGNPDALTVTSEPANEVVTEGEEVRVNSEVTATNGAGALKQAAYRVLFADNGVDNVIRLDSVHFLADGIDVTQYVTFSDSLGNQVTELLESEASHRKVYVTVTAGGPIQGEIHIPGQSTVQLELVMRVRGIGSNADGDAVKLELLADNAPPVTGAVYVVRGTGSDVRARLATTPNGQGTIYNFIWSDLSASPHSALFGVSSGDWKNGYGVTFNVHPAIFHSRIRR